MLKIGARIKNAVRTLTSSSGRNASPKLAPLQEAALEERCILVDEFDKPIGGASKRNCHKVNADGDVLLHRAFSIFLFNNSGDLLLQKRSANKITFPSYYTNTCCSHPLMEIPGENEETDAIGVRRAARRRLFYELGIPTSEIDLNEFYYLTRIHYHALGDGTWGEHEIDYVLFLQKNKVTLDPNPDEISEIRWVSKSNINNFLNDCHAPLTPWFQLILTHRLPLWWDNLNSLHKVQDRDTIQRFT
ncbi:GSCOCG00001668001-RA-CDS [Cotesia congregata]|uniref:isopentenyl-diphosphate Delta-isomerase n=1 Tax=Cotesia congregata TaxID=51543 RepID=A0A8J2HQN9_COTCN|nr:GSCOCG00001668001-RA-CDS [Cotesia congregata]CAG5106992.1 Similar to IDI1: Isopentenyl-diphosphate Delta-isomerase 1 (Mesocricetus auratus) [Cotesia congregata]